jgi:hypothetical protein
MRPERTIYRMIHGSVLYGTNTPDSDFDFKEVFLPSGSDILLGRIKEGRQQGPIKTSENQKNEAGDIDVQSFAVNKLFKMIASGDIIGCEMIFTPKKMIEFIAPEYQLILDSKDIFLSKKVDGYVGYCKQQAAKYGIRGSRIAATRKIVDLLEPHVSKNPLMKVREIWPEIVAYANNTEHAKIISIMNSGTETSMDHLCVCEKKTPLSITVKEAHQIYKRAFDKAGERTLAAEKNEGVDWKAVSHAVRVGQQAIELLQTGWITFPRPNAEYLLTIKKGEIDYKKIAAELEELLLQVEEASPRSKLPDKPNWSAIDALTCQLYAMQISN